jgi:hypothetical protein
LELRDGQDAESPNLTVVVWTSGQPYGHYNAVEIPTFIGVVEVNAGQESIVSQAVTFSDLHPSASNPSPADGSISATSGAFHTLRVDALKADTATFYFDDDEIVEFSMTGTPNGNSFEAEVPFVVGQFTDDGTNYWRVRLENDFGSVFFPEAGFFSFTATP